MNLEVVFMSGTEFFHLLADKYGGGDKRLKKAWDAHFFVYDEFGRSRAYRKRCGKNGREKGGSRMEIMLTKKLVKMISGVRNREE